MTRMSVTKPGISILTRSMPLFRGIGSTTTRRRMTASMSCSMERSKREACAYPNSANGISTVTAPTMERILSSRSNSSHVDIYGTP